MSIAAGKGPKVAATVPGMMTDGRARRINERLIFERFLSGTIRLLGLGTAAERGKPG
jgi:hypothetical protein